MARQRFSDEDDDRDDRPRRRDDRDRDDRRDDDYDDRPRRRDDRDDDYDDRPRAPRSKPGLATAAGVLWAIWAGFELIGVVLSGINMANPAAAMQAQLAGPRGLGGAVIFDKDITNQLTILAVFRLIVNLAAFVLFLVACIRTLTGGAKSLTVYGMLTIVMSVLTIIYCLFAGYVVNSIMTKMVGAFAVASGGTAFVYGAVCGAGLLAISGSLLAGIFAMSCNKRYTQWWDAVKGRRRDDY